MKKCPVHNITDCSPLLNGCSRLTQPEFAGDGKNPLARIDIYAFAGWNGDVDMHVTCDCSERLLRGDGEVNLQDLVTAVHEHAKVCPLHLANLAAIQKERNRG